jgi:hypothetical protein
MEIPARFLGFKRCWAGIKIFYDTCWVQFSQSNLHKGSVLPKKIIKFFMLGKGVNIIFLKKTSFHNADSQKIENSWSQTRYYFMFLIINKKSNLKLNNYWFD